MAKLDGYEDTIVVQRNASTGCIPSGIEWMARYMGVADEPLDSLQEEFDLEAQGKGGNGFYNVPTAVAAKHTRVRTTPITFGDASRKIDFIVGCMERGTPCLVSLWQGNRAFHIVPVVAADEKSITVLWMDKETVNEQLRVIDHDKIRQWHDAIDGGRDVLIWGDAPEEEE